MNKAANVALLEAGIIDMATARNNARTIAALDLAMLRPGVVRTGDYQQIEPQLIAIGGIEVSTLHCGRSRVDIVATSRRLLLRPAILGALDVLNAARQALMDLGQRHKRSLLPVYTQGRQSAGVPVGHYISAYTAALDVEFDNLKQAYDTVNQSPLGAGAVATSSFPLNRQRLSDLLGFACVIENSLFANELSIIGAGAKVVSAATSAAIIVGTLASDLESQYARTTPWFTIAEGPGLTGTSSSMPHKVNPTLLNHVRQQASVLIGTAMTYTLRSHNVPHGMPDSKRSEPNLAMAQYTQLMNDVARLVRHLDFDEAVARQEVDAEYSATPELADVLQQLHNVPFHVGHHFASALVRYGKANGWRPAHFPYDVARSLYADSARQAGILPAVLPLDEDAFKTSLSSANLVARAACLGGPQPAEVDRMMTAGLARIAADAAWLTKQRDALAAASALLDTAFASTQ
nr:lyase family protein [Pigmentiphaga litoralis]